MSKNTPASRGHFDNLGILRLLLASLVVYSHSYPLTNNPEPIADLTQSYSGGSIAVQAFFLISGYLVTQSLQTSNSLPHYLISRFLRIWPALVCALLFTIGCAWLSSKTPFGEFLLGSWHYLTKNILLVAGVSYELPGAFPNNPTTSVNGSLWTLPWEVRCYLGLVLVWCLGLLALRRHFALTLIVIAVLMYVSPDILAFLESDNPDVPWLIGFFMMGAFAYAIAAHLSPLAFGLILAAAALALLTVDTKIAIALTIASAILVLGFSSLIRLPGIKTDLSYGTYIYAFPIQQLLVHVWPAITPLLLFATTMVLLLPIAALSWFLIEKPALALRKPLLALYHKWFSRPDTHSANEQRPSIFFSTASWVLALVVVAWLFTPQSSETETIPETTWGLFYPMEGKLYLRHHWSSGFADAELVIPPGHMPLLGQWSGQALAIGSFDSGNCEFLLHDTLSPGPTPLRLAVDCLPLASQALSGDWNGDGITDIGLFFPQHSEFRLWTLRDRELQLFQHFRFNGGVADSVAISGDWDGDGVDTVGLWHAPSQQFLLTNQHGNHAGTIIVPVSAAPDAMPFALRTEGISRVGLHLWQQGVLTLPQTNQHITYGTPGLLAIPVFE